MQNIGNCVKCEQGVNHAHRDLLLPAYLVPGDKLHPLYIGLTQCRDKDSAFLFEWALGEMADLTCLLPKERNVLKRLLRVVAQWNKDHDGRDTDDDLVWMSQIKPVGH